MQILFKTDSTLKIRKLYKRLGEITQPLRQTSALQRSKSQRHILVSETVAVRRLLTNHSMPNIVTYPVPGKNTVNDITYIEPNRETDKGLVRINQSQYFENVPPDIWNYCVGNYCVCQRWLKVREGTTLDRKSIQDYQRLVMLVGETINLMNNVDSLLVGS